MTKPTLVAALLALASVVSACTSSGSVTTTSSLPESSTTLPSLTTLPPATTSTTVATTTTEPTTTTTSVPLPENECVVEPYASIYEYSQGCTVLGITLLAEEEVDVSAIDAMADRVFHMLVTRPDLAEALLEAPVEGRAIGRDQRITSLPEFEDLYDQYPGNDWNRSGRSFPGTEDVPFFAGSEEDLLCLEGDRFEGEDDFVRWFALTIRRFGLDIVDPAASSAIDGAYGRAIAQGLWENTLAEINSDEYWMEGVQSYFDANLENTEEDREPNSSHNQVNTRNELADYDPTLYSIAVSVFGDGEWRPSCP